MDGIHDEKAKMSEMKFEKSITQDELAKMMMMMRYLKSKKVSSRSVMVPAYYFCQATGVIPNFTRLIYIYVVTSTFSSSQVT
jgi:hypothetical protein